MESFFPFELLPTDLFLSVCSFFSWNELKTFFSVSKFWFEILSSPKSEIFWRDIWVKTIKCSFSLFSLQKCRSWLLQLKNIFSGNFNHEFISKFISSQSLSFFWYLHSKTLFIVQFSPDFYDIYIDIFQNKSTIYHKHFFSEYSWSWINYYQLIYPSSSSHIVLLFRKGDSSQGLLFDISKVILENQNDQDSPVKNIILPIAQTQYVAESSLNLKQSNDVKWKNEDIYYVPDNKIIYISHDMFVLWDIFHGIILTTIENIIDHYCNNVVFSPFFDYFISFSPNSSSFYLVDLDSLHYHKCYIDGDSSITHISFHYPYIALFQTDTLLLFSALSFSLVSKWTFYIYKNYVQTHTQHNSTKVRFLFSPTLHHMFVDIYFSGAYIIDLNSKTFYRLDYFPTTFLQVHFTIDGFYLVLMDTQSSSFWLYTLSNHAQMVFKLASYPCKMNIGTDGIVFLNKNNNFEIFNFSKSDSLKINSKPKKIKK